MMGKTRPCNSQADSCGQPRCGGQGGASDPQALVRDCSTHCSSRGRAAWLRRTESEPGGAARRDEAIAAVGGLDGGATG